MDINHDWSLSLQVSSTMNIHRGFGDPPMVDMDGDFLPEVVPEGGGQSCSVAVPIDGAFSSRHITGDL